MRISDWSSDVCSSDLAAPLFLAELARLDCGGTGITHRDSVDADGNWRYPIGTGPFRWGEWRHKQYIDLPRFDGYRSLPGAPDGIGGGKRALVDRVRFSVIPDGSAAAAGRVRASIHVLARRGERGVGEEGGSTSRPR